MTIEKRTAFFSYAHEDKEFAERIVRDLLDAGVNVWFDKWDIMPGDSIIQKIFNEGLSQCDTFLLLLSQSSVNSRWVKEELDFAVVKKIEGLTRLIPILKETCEIPGPLKALLWVDLSQDFDEGIREIVKAIYEVREKPPLGPVPTYVEALAESVGGLSRLATTVGLAMIGDVDEHREKFYDGGRLREMLPEFSVEEINDAVDELDEFGLISLQKYIGTAPYTFGHVQPTYALYLHFNDAIPEYDCYEDIKAVAASIASVSQVNGSDIQKLTGLPPNRINRAVEYLEDYGMARVIKYMGTAPFRFGEVEPTRKTREYVHDQCR